MKKELAEWQLIDAMRLKRLFEQRAKMTQRLFGKRYHIGSQGLVCQYLSGMKPLNLSVLLKFSQGLGVAPQCISPTLAAELRAAGLVQIDKGRSSSRQHSDPLINEAAAILEKLAPPLRSQALALLQVFAGSYGKEHNDNKSKSYPPAA